MLSGADAFHKVDTPCDCCDKGWDNPAPSKPIEKGVNVVPALLRLLLYTFVVMGLLIAAFFIILTLLILL